MHEMRQHYGNLGQHGTVTCAIHSAEETHGHLMTQLVQILLPVAHADHSSGKAVFDPIRTELTEKFGGVTLYSNAPAEGLWSSDGSTERDQIVIAEVMVDEIDAGWWRAFRIALERRFHQDEIVVRAIPVTRL